MIPFRRWGPYAIPTDVQRAATLHQRFEFPTGIYSAAPFHSPPDSGTNGGRLTSPGPSSHSPTVSSSTLPMQFSPPSEESKSCLICGDRATGLHYGIVSCEGCKGFFKRSICNRRVYKCMKDKKCMMSRQKRNRCQYCRLLKCLQVGMNRKAIREDGMPGGRNKSIGPVKLTTEEIDRIMTGEEYDKEYMRPVGVKSPTTGSDGTSPTFSPTSLSSSSGEHFEFPASSMAAAAPAHGPPVAMFFDPQLIRKTSGHNKGTHGVKGRSSANGTRGGFEYARSDLPLLPEVESLLAAESEIEMSLPFDLPTNRPILYSELFEFLCKLMDSVLHREIDWAKRLPFAPKLTVRSTTSMLSDTWLDAVLLATMRGHPTDLYVGLSTVLANYIPREEEVQKFGHEGLEIMDMAKAVSTRYQKLNVSIQEHLCLKVVNFLNPDVKSMADPEAVESLRKQYYFVLHDHVQLNNNAAADRFRDLLSLLPNIKILSRKVGEMPFDCAPLLFKAMMHACGPKA